MTRPTDNQTAVFVYGTLMRGECRHSLLCDQQFVSAATTAPQYRLLRVADYPGLVDAIADNGVSVSGEVWLVDNESLQRLDATECVDDGLYERRKIHLQEPHSSEPIGSVHAWFYLRDTQGLADIGNDWRSANA